MAVRSVRFFGPTRLVSLGYQSVYTVPVDRVALMKSIGIRCDVATALAPVTFTIAITPAADAPYDVCHFTFAAPGQAVVPFTPLVLRENDELRIKASVINAGKAFGFGSLLQGDAT